MKLIAQFGLFNGIIVMVIIMTYALRRSVNRIFLCLSIFFVWYTLLVVYLTLTKQILNYPVFHRTALISSYLALPFLYIYSRNTFYPGKLWRNSDWLFFLPTVVYLVDYFPFLLLPAERKIATEKIGNKQNYFGVQSCFTNVVRCSLFVVQTVNCQLSTVNRQRPRLLNITVMHSWR